MEELKRILGCIDYTEITNTRKALQRLAEAQERLALATQLRALCELAAIPGASEVHESKIVCQVAEVMRRLDKISQPEAPKETP